MSMTIVEGLTMVNGRDDVDLESKIVIPEPTSSTGFVIGYIFEDDDGGTHLGVYVNRSYRCLEADLRDFK